MFLFFISAKFKFDDSDSNLKFEDNRIVRIPEGMSQTIDITRIGDEQEKSVSKSN